MRTENGKRLTSNRSLTFEVNVDLKVSIKFDVTWSYVKRQTGKMTSEFVFFSSNPSLNHIKIEKCLHKYKFFHSTVQRAKNRRPKFHFCRLPFDVRPRNVKLNLSILSIVLKHVFENTGFEGRQFQCFCCLLHCFLSRFL